MKDTPLAVSRFENRNGVTSWRVSGWLAGVRIRKNFKTREKAAIGIKKLETEAGHATAGFRKASTLLADDQIREAESVFKRLEKRRRSLTFYVDYALAHYREPEREMPLTEAVATYLKARAQDHTRGLLSASMVKQITWELDALKRHFPDITVDQLTAKRLAPFFERSSPSLKTYNNRRCLVHTFLKFAFQQDWIDANPVEKMRHFRIAHRRGSATTLNAKQCAELMEHVETVADGQLVPFYALCLFAGIRPAVRDGEIAKLKPEHIRLDTGVILIEPEVSKVRMKRFVTIHPNLAAWLRAYPFQPVNAHAIEHFRKPVVEKFKLSHDILRHTFISMHVAKYRSMGEAALQAGNSESIIRKHYLDLKSKEEAEEFFAIMPKHKIAPIAFPDQPPRLQEAG